MQSQAWLSERHGPGEGAEGERGWGWGGRVGGSVVMEQWNKVLRLGSDFGPPIIALGMLSGVGNGKRTSVGW